MVWPFKPKETLSPHNGEFDLLIADIIVDLEGRIEHEYRDTLMYPGQRRRYERDMEQCVRLRELLELRKPL